MKFLMKFKALVACTCIKQDYFTMNINSSSLNILLKKTFSNHLIPLVFIPERTSEMSCWFQHWSLCQGGLTSW